MASTVPRHSSLRVLLEHLRGFKRSLCSQFIRMKHDNGGGRAGCRSPDHASGTEGVRISAHAAVSIVAVEALIAAPDNTSNLRSLAQSGISDFEVRVAPV